MTEQEKHDQLRSMVFRAMGVTEEEQEPVNIFDGTGIAMFDRFNIFGDNEERRSREGQE